MNKYMSIQTVGASPRTNDIKQPINPFKTVKSHSWLTPSAIGVSYHFEWGQYQDDIANLAAVLPPVLRPLQAGDAHVAPLETLHVAAETERREEEGLDISTPRLTSSALHYYELRRLTSAATLRTGFKCVLTHTQIPITTDTLLYLCQDYRI